MLTRRTALLLGLGMPAFTATDFWNDKDPAAWSDKEAERLLSKSPWAKETAVTLDTPGLIGSYGDGSHSDSGRGPGATAGAGMGGGSMAGTRGGGATPTVTGEDGGRGQLPVRVLVRWESATPMRQAARKPIPPLASQYYIVTMSGLPAIGHESDLLRDDPETVQTRKHLEDQLKAGTELLRKGKEPIYPERLQVLDKESTRTVVFLFSRTPEALTLEDKEVTFMSAVGSLQFKVRFPLKEMMYHGKLDL